MCNSFKPEGENTKVTVSSSASAATKLTDNPDSVRVANLGTAAVWVKFGDSTVVATSADLPFGPGITEVIRPAYQRGPLYVSCIAAGSTGDIYFTPGTGL